MQKLYDFITDLKTLQDNGYIVENNLVQKLDVNVIAHFGNLPCLEIVCENCIPYSCINNIRNLGYLLQCIVELLGMEREGGIRLSEMTNIPCRLVCEPALKGADWGAKVVGIGHFTKDEFVLFEDMNRSLANV